MHTSGGLGRTLTCWVGGTRCKKCILPINSKHVLQRTCLDHTLKFIMFGLNHFKTKTSTLVAQDELAQMWLRMFPQKAYDLLRQKKLPPGSRLVSVSSEVTTPTCKECLVFVFASSFTSTCQVIYFTVTTFSKMIY